MPWRNTDMFCSLAPSDLMRAKHFRRPQELSGQPALSQCHAQAKCFTRTRSLELYNISGRSHY